MPARQLVQAKVINAPLEHIVPQALQLALTALQARIVQTLARPQQQPANLAPLEVIVPPHLLVPCVPLENIVLATLQLAVHVMRVLIALQLVPPHLKHVALALLEHLVVLVPQAAHTVPPAQRAQRMPQHVVPASQVSTALAPLLMLVEVYYTLAVQALQYKVLEVKLFVPPAIPALTG
jgi:hypothetical protein